ncbi:MAG: LysR family transcriptional regulator, partial [Mesorhizobium sp.]
MAAMQDFGAISGVYEKPPGDGETLLRSGLSLRHMRMITALDDHGRVSAAAQVMNISQPAASRMIAEMEAVLDVR